MKHVGKLVVAFALAVGLSGAPWAFADATQGGEILGIDSSPLKTLTVTSDTNSAGDFGPGSLIFGMKVVAESASAQCTLYDAATVAAGTNSTVIDEVIEPTDEDMTIQMWPRPYKLVTDLSIDVTTVRACTVYYQ